MKITLFLALIYSNLAFAISGLQIANKVNDSNNHKFAIYKYEMTLFSKSNKAKKRNFTLLYSHNNQYDAESLIVFTRPKRFAKTAMLTHNKKGKNSDQWLFLPALKKKRRISSSKKNGRFVGSDLTYEDFENREVKMDTYKLIKIMNSKNKKYYILESKPKDQATSQYSKVISKVDASNWVVIQAQFFKNGNKKVHKTIKSSKIIKIGSLWITHKSLITNHDIKHRTELNLINSEFNQKLPRSIFTSRGLENQSSIKKYIK
jgi:hypothetical protein